MPKDKDGRPILTDSDWKTGEDRKSKTGEDRKKESPAVTIWGAIWRALLLLGLIAIVRLAKLPHSPADKGDGPWESVKIPFASFTKGKNKNVKKIRPAGISLEDVLVEHA